MFDSITSNVGPALNPGKAFLASYSPLSFLDAGFTQTYWADKFDWY